MTRTGALKAGEHGRRAGSGRLNQRHAIRIRKIFIERMADQLALPSYQWASESAPLLIEREYGITVSVTTADRYLKAWGMSA
ncbi:winged helix-turn-helix domain-containing protein [Burkholderia sp. HI2714]|uniref:winged helix-turn-helix domain-containing protein n=1 Tax=Burkholderia sp. HI2714 TaxID=2015359 RepID=UPI00117FABED|nr:winged helix-turn-helix domain-containing protein [Burkholderia sp. HI2714]